MNQNPANVAEHDVIFDNTANLMMMKMMMVLNPRQKGSLLRPVFKSYTVYTFTYKAAFKKCRNRLDW